MKFHCDRCKTRYSIADERVRGKILKIRCRACSSVITVREGSGDSPPPSRAGARKAGAGGRGGGARSRAAPASALQSSVEQVLSADEFGETSGDPPAVLDAEWFVSKDGQPFGPFSLQKAREWVSARLPIDELFCWSEGFDDWLPVEKVSHFRGLRGESQSSGLAALPGSPSGASGRYPRSGVPGREETPVPLFAATLAQVVANSTGEGQGADRSGNPAPTFGARNGSQASSPALPGSRPGRAGAPGKPSPDLEIGDASLVVDVSRGPRGVRSAAPPGPPGAAGAGPLGRGTGTHGRSGAHAALPFMQRGAPVDMGRPEIMLPHQRSSGMMVPIAIGLAVVVGVVSVLFYVALSGKDEEELVRRGQVGGKGGLAYSFDDQGKKADAGVVDQKSGDQKSGDRAPADAGGKSESDTRRVRKPTGGQVAVDQVPLGPGKKDEVDLSSETARELRPDDLIDVYNANKIGVTMCYNSALKRDPLLTVRRVDVLITVATSGAVSSVSIPSLNGTPLGTCLQRRIRAWKFPRASRVFTSQFPIIFQT